LVKKGRREEKYQTGDKIGKKTNTSGILNNQISLK